MTPRLKDFGYPAAYIVSVADGEDDYDMPQEAWTAHECGNCRLWDKHMCICREDGSEREPEDTCEHIDYIELRLDSSLGFRDPVRCEYESDEDYEQACGAIERLNKWLDSERWDDE